MSWHKRVEQLERRAATTHAHDDPEAARTRILARLAALGERLRRMADLEGKTADQRIVPGARIEVPTHTLEDFREYFAGLRARLAQRRAA